MVLIFEWEPMHHTVNHKVKNKESKDESRVKSQKVRWFWRKCDTILAPNEGLIEGNQARQPAEDDADVDSHRKTETKDPNSEEGDTEEY